MHSLPCFSAPPAVLSARLLSRALPLLCSDSSDNVSPPPHPLATACCALFVQSYMLSPARTGANVMYTLPAGQCHVICLKQVPTALPSLGRPTRVANLVAAAMQGVGCEGAEQPRGSIRPRGSMSYNAWRRCGDKGLQRLNQKGLWPKNRRLDTNNWTSAATALQGPIGG